MTQKIKIQTTLYLLPDLAKIWEEMPAVDQSNMVARALKATIKPPPGTAGHKLAAMWRASKNQGRVWALPELQAAGLPFYWDLIWFQSQIDSGKTYTAIALEYGYNPKTVSQFAIRELGVKRKTTPSSAEYADARAKLATGSSRAEVAASLGVSLESIRAHTTDLTDDRSRAVDQRLELGGPYPATLEDFVNRLGLNQIQAGRWASEMYRKGYLNRVTRGLYTRGETKNEE